MGKYIEISADFAEDNMLINSDTIQTIEPYNKLHAQSRDYQLLFKMINYEGSDYDETYRESYSNEKDRDIRYEKLKKKLT